MRSPTKDTGDSLARNVEGATDAKVEKAGQSTEEKNMLEFARRKIDDAVKVIYPLVKEGKLPNEDLYLYESEDPEVKKTLDKVHEDLDNDGSMLRIVSDRVSELLEKSKTENELISEAETIANFLFGNIPSTSHDTRQLRAKLEGGIESCDIDKTVLALRNMASEGAIAFSRERINKLAVLLVKKDMAELFFSTANERLFRLTDRAQHLAS